MFPLRVTAQYDWTALLSLLRESFAGMEGRIDPPSSLNRLTPESLALQAQRGEIWVIEDQETPVACIFLTPQVDRLYLGKLAVHTTHQHRGLGRQLVDLAQQRAHALNLPLLELQTRIELTENHATFAALGFAITAQTAHEGYAHPTSITMQKPVKAAMTDKPSEDLDRHAMKMAKKKAARDKIMATKTDKKGLIIVHTGKGKGKSSAAFGMIFRCIAHDMKCAVVQFIKGGMSTGERDLILSKFADECAFHTMGEGFTWETQDKSRDTEMAQAAWAKAKDLIRDESNKMVLLDEINIAIRYDYVDIAEVVEFLATEKPDLTHVVLTGRNAHADLIEIADLVTEMELVKHPFRSGIKAQIGVEF